MQRYVIYLQTFQCDMRYKKTTEHGNVDALPLFLLGSDDLPPQLNSSNVIDESRFFQISPLSILPLTFQINALTTKSNPLITSTFSSSHFSF